MKVEDISLLATALALILGTIGGVPQIKRWITPRPHLKIVKAEVGKEPSKNRHTLHVEVLNEKKWWRRDSDALDVVAG